MEIVLSMVASQLPITMAGPPRHRAITLMLPTPSQVTQQDMVLPDGVIEAVAAAVVDPAHPVTAPLIRTGAAVADGLVTVSPIVGSVKLLGQPWPLVV